MKNSKGHGRNPKYPVGTVRVHTRHKRGGERRAWVKVTHPNKWVLRCRHVWEQHHGPIPKGMGIHHKDEDKLNDSIDNLELVSKARHLAIHMPTYKAQVIANLVRQRKERKWSTKSKTKKTGRHPKSCDCPLHRST